jgi:Fe-S cluster assembly protein SufD
MIKGVGDMSEELLINNSEKVEVELSAGEQRQIRLLSPRNLHLTIHQKQGSDLLLHAVSLADEDAHISINVFQEEPGCTTALYGLAFTRGKQVVNIETHVFHNVGHGKSSKLFKNVLADDSRVSFYGELKVLPDAQKTEAFQTNRNLLLSRSAKVETRPQLEIYADDVKCSHGATTGQLDANALFYMQQRGIPKEQAQRLLLQAFLEEVVQTIPDEKFQADVRRQINERL